MIPFEEFERRAREYFLEIPEHFRVRVDGPAVEREAHADTLVHGTYVLGECVHHPDWSGESPLFSTVVLYYGSFVALARRDPHFDVDAELRETVQHEVQHHLEDAAGIPTLRDLDWAEEQNGLRRDGKPHAERFWRGGEREGPGTWRVGDDVFVEISLRPAAWRRAHEQGLEVTAGDETLTIAPEDVPEEPPEGGVMTFETPADEYGDVVVMLSRRRAALFGNPFRKTS